jgi:hypothetical protein
MHEIVDIPECSRDHVGHLIELDTRTPHGLPRKITGQGVTATANAGYSVQGILRHVTPFIRCDTTNLARVLSSFL